MPKKKTIEEVALSFEKRGYVLLDKEYINATKPLHFICPKHPDENLSIRYANLKQGQGCKYCGEEKKRESMRIPYEEVKRNFRKRGYILLDTEYINAHTKLRYKCLKHPEYELEISYTSLMSDHGCMYCGKQKLAFKKRRTIEEVSRKFEERGYTLLEKEYRNDTQKLRFKCPKHPEKQTYITFQNLRDGAGCSYCKRDALREKNLKHNIETVKKEFSKRGYVLLDDVYITNMNPVNYICLKHPNKVRKITFNSFQSGQGCRECGVEKRSGGNAYNWKGGTSTLNDFLRSSIKEWIIHSLKSNDYRCFVTGDRGGKLEVHHAESFYTLRDTALKNTNLEIRENISNYTNDELKTLSTELKRLHMNVKGYPLKKDIHKSFHREYGKINNTYEQLLEFKEKWEKGLVTRL